MVAVFLAEGFEIAEALVPVDYLRRAGIETVTVSVGERTVKSSCGVCVVADRLAGELDPAALEAVVLPGGMPGASNLSRSPAVNAAIDSALQSGAVIGAICAAPAVVLARRGLLRGKRATCYPSFREELLGCLPADTPVVWDKPFVTAVGPGYADAFGLCLIEQLRGAEAAGRVRAGLCL